MSRKLLCCKVLFKNQSMSLGIIHGSYCHFTKRFCLLVWYPPMLVLEITPFCNGLLWIARKTTRQKLQANDPLMVRELFINVKCFMLCPRNPREDFLISSSFSELTDPGQGERFPFNAPLISPVGAPRPRASTQAQTGAQIVHHRYLFDHCFPLFVVDESWRLARRVFSTCQCFTRRWHWQLLQKEGKVRGEGKTGNRQGVLGGRGKNGGI